MDFLSIRTLKNNASEIMALEFKGNPFKSKLIFEIIIVNNNTATISGLRISKYINSTPATIKIIVFKI